MAVPRVWIADQGNNQVGGANPNNRILEIDPVNHKNPPDAQGDVIILKTLPSPAAAFLDELDLDDQQRLWTVVKQTSDQVTDGCRRIDKETGAVQVSITPTFPGEGPGSLVYLEGLAFDGSSLWLTGVQQNGGPNVLTRVDPLTGSRVAPFDTGPGKVNIPGNVCQGLLYDPSGTGYLWHSDVQQRIIYKLDIANNFAVVKQFAVPSFPPKGMAWMGGKIWVAAPFSGIWEIDPASGASNGGAVKLFNTPQWNLDGIAILEEPPGPKIVVTPTVVERSVWIGDDPANSSFQISNGGDGTLNYTVSETTPWLGVSPESGSSTGEADTITITYQGVSGFTAGLYEAAITVASPGAFNSPQQVIVRLTVETVRPDHDGDGDVDLRDFGQFQLCISGAGITSPPGCNYARLDLDTDVDATDLLIFRNCLSGESAPANPACDDLP